jgi:N-acetylneuraminic acid mutarotase
MMTMPRVLVALLASLSLSAGCSCDPSPPDVVEGEGGRWELLTPLAEGPRQETAVVALRGEIVVMGGFNGLGAVVPLVEAYDPVDDRWRRLADLPTPVHHANAAVVDGKIIVAGFLVGVEFQPDGRVFIYDPDANEWSAGTPMTAGTQRGACGVAVDNDGGVLLFGGSAGGSSALVSRYDVNDDAWSELADLPDALDHLGAGTIDGRIFIVGGRTNGLANHTTATLEFDPLGGDDESGAFLERAPMPTARAGFGIAVLGGELFVAGGEGNSARDDGVFPETEAYDPATDAWRSVLDMRTPRHGMGAAAVAGALYVPGGADVQQFAAVDIVERFVPSTP